MAALSAESSAAPRPCNCYHSPARARRIAGLSGFLTLIRSCDGPER
jgi:hypothetical protein